MSFMGGIFLVAGMMAILGDILDIELAWWHFLLGFILGLVLAALLNNVLSRALGIGQRPFGANAVILDDVLTITFFNPLYAKMFAEANEWQPEP